MEVSTQFLADLIDPDSGVPLKDVLILRAGDEKNSPKILQETYDPKDLEALRRELPLNLLNFLREETENILLSSQACGQTPLKATHPSKYKYESPVKPKIQDDRSKKNGRKLNMDSGGIRKNSNQKKLEDRLSMPQHDSIPLKLNQGDKGRNIEKNHKKRCSLDLNVSPREWRPDIPIQTEKKRGKKSNKRRSDPIPTNISHDIDVNISKAPVVKENLAKITEDDKKKYDNYNQWAQITSSLDKHHNEAKNTIEASPLNSMNSNDESLEFIEPSLASVQEKDKLSLERLAKLYNLCIDHRLVPNILVELDLVLQLLTVKDRIPSSKPLGAIPRKTGLFATVHNSVFFASVVLSHQVDLLCHLNYDTIIYLVENNRLKEFCPENVIKTLESYKAEARSNYDPINSSSINSLDSVRFQEETDSRNNFPNVKTFTDFKKQRDLFYELLKNWDESKSSDQFGISVIKILRLQESPVNLRHFARLFTNQMLMTCLKELSSSGQDKMDDTSLEKELEMLKMLKKDPSKIRKLQSRLRPSVYGGPCPSPHFTKCQEFFKEFLCSSTYAFIVHLKQVMKDMILSMNDTNFDLDNDLPLMEIDNLILKLRILAKYLAMIEFLPFCKHGSNMPQQFQESQLKFQENDFKKPVVDFETIICDALKQGRLVITLPWIIEYCSMLDLISAKLDYFQEIFKKLVSIYRNMTFTKIPPKKTTYIPDGGMIEDILSPMKNVSLDPVHRNQNNGIEFNQFFLCIHLGWLFENPIFPREFFVEDVSNVVEICYTEKKTIDSCRSIQARLLYDCCPYLNELNVVLSHFLTGLKSQKMPKNVRKIPIKIKPKPKIPTPAMNMQEKLEEHFFYYTQGSVEETVNLIIKRVSANVVRILSEKIAESDKDVLKEISENLKILNEDSCKEELIDQVSVLSRTSFLKINCITKNIVEEELKRTVDAALTILMPDDTNDSVMKVCRDCIERRVRIQAKIWLNGNCSEEYFRESYLKDFEKLWNNRLVPPIKQSAMVHCDLKEKPVIVMSLHEILIQLKSDTSKMVIDGVMLNYSEETLLILLKNIELSYVAAFLDVIIDEKPYLDNNVKGFEHMSFDWVLALFTFHPKLMTSNVQDKIISLWGGQIPSQATYRFSLSPPLVPIGTLFSRRNLYLLGRSSNPHSTWDRMEHFIGRLLKYHLIFMFHLRDQCLDLMQTNSTFLEEYPTHLKKQFGSCLKGVYETWKRNNKHNDEDDDEFWTDWLSWVICSIDDDDIENDFNYIDFPDLC